MAIQRAASKQSTAIQNQIFLGISQTAVINIPIDQIVPAPLHIVLGLTKNVIDRIELECDKMGVKRLFDSALRVLGVIRDPYTKNFTGNHVRKLLCEKGRKLFRDCLSGLTEFRSRIDDLRSHMSIVQSIGMKSTFLTPDEIQHLRISAEEFVLLYHSTFDDSSLTPKAHILLHHLPEFAEKFKFVGLLSEQGIESTHHRFNLAENRFASITNEEKRWRRILAENAMRNALFDQKLESDVGEEFIQAEKE